MENIYKVNKVTDKIPLIISSVRPFFKNSAYTKMQKDALVSWNKISDKTYLFNDVTDLEGFNDVPVFTEIPSKNPPTIKEMIKFAASNFSDDTVMALVNSDIVLTGNIRSVYHCVQNNKLGKAWAATSQRYEFAEADMSDAQVVDMGLDFFIAPINVWKHMIADIPEYLTIGRNMWDTWVNTWLRQRVSSTKYFDITDWKAVMHPKHSRKPNRLEPVEGTKVPDLIAPDKQAYTLPHAKYAKP